MKKGLSTIWGRWKKISYRAMEFQAKVILGVLYFTVLPPLGLWFKTTHDTLREKKVASNWQDWPYTKADVEIRKM